MGYSTAPLQAHGHRHPHVVFTNAMSDTSLVTGALIWHGRDLRRYKRLLSPPLQRLLTCPGTAALGRGVAAMPASYAHQVCSAATDASCIGRDEEADPALLT